jgi:hypothetical protein
MKLPIEIIFTKLYNIFLEGIYLLTAIKIIADFVSNHLNYLIALFILSLIIVCPRDELYLTIFSILTFITIWLYIIEPTLGKMVLRTNSLHSNNAYLLVEYEHCLDQYISFYSSFFGNSG